ncbi:FHA domain-containing protein [Mycolicibacterium arenosum]|uniref:FHA domain-containing protein n=1 Tax=Mycolicibacterium arenosum TaxID=2952157 RepID=A0ABT1M021_9MYCO|nr:FHA domain-containing protein [Mycolicibacterium sp. CAU 1645]MCP9272494.1 FHA domain-containing protein [Mycolicibacterium sp. CAU 1645]
MTSSEANLEPGSLVVRTDRSTYVVSPRMGTATIGRDPHAQVQLDDSRISRVHVRLELVDGAWVASDTSMNGMFIGSSRTHSAVLTDGMAVRLGDPAAGPLVRFEVTPVPPRPAEDESTNLLVPIERDEDESTVSLHPGMVRAGAAAAARRRELDISQRSLAAEGIINAGALIAFEKGRSWPRERTRARLEEVLQWPSGTIAQIKEGRSTPPTQPSGVVYVQPPATPSANPTPAAQAGVGGDESALIAQAVEAAVNSLGSTIDALPPLEDADFTPRASAILVDLRQLEAVAARATRIGRVTPTLIKALSTVRREIEELTLLASTASTATLGQRLYAARRRAALTVGEIAQAAGVPEDVLAQAEADQPVSAAETALIEALLEQLA